jgi:iron complex transport system substrate-binding protein
MNHLAGTSLQPLKRLSPFLCLTWVLGLLLSACGGPVGATPTAAPTGSTLTDALGRTVEFAQLPQRIVVAGKSSLTIVGTLFLFPEARERVVGYVAGNQNPGDFLGLVDPSFGAKAVLEVEAGPEQIVPLNPDVVILRSFMADNLGKPLEQVDIPVVYVDLETPEQYFRDVATLGGLFGNEARAAEIADYYQSHLDAIESAVGGLSADQKPRVLLLQYSDKGGEVALNVPSASWLQTTEVELAGGDPVWKEAAQSGGWTVVNFEQIAAWDPDQIFLIHYNADASKTVQQLKADPRWQALKAVQDGAIYGFAADTFSWDQPEPRWLLGVIWLAGKMLPERFSDLDMLQEVHRFFGEMYGLDESAIQEQIVPNLKGDVE